MHTRDLQTNAGALLSHTTSHKDKTHTHTHSQTCRACTKIHTWRYKHNTWTQNTAIDTKMDSNTQNGCMCHPMDLYCGLFQRSKGWDVARGTSWREWRPPSNSPVNKFTEQCQFVYACSPWQQPTKQKVTWCLQMFNKVKWNKLWVLFFFPLPKKKKNQLGKLEMGLPSYWWQQQFSALWLAQNPLLLWSCRSSLTDCSRSFKSTRWRRWSFSSSYSVAATPRQTVNVATWKQHLSTIILTGNTFDRSLSQLLEFNLMRCLSVSDTCCFQVSKIFFQC